MLLEQFITLVDVLVIMYWRLRTHDSGDTAGAVYHGVEVLVVMQWRIRSRQRNVACAVCKGNTRDNDCLHLLLWRQLDIQFTGKRATEAIVLLFATRDNAYRSSGLWKPLFEPWCTDIFTVEKVDIHVKINQGGRLMEVPPHNWILLSRNILPQNVKEVIASTDLLPYAYSD